MKGTPVARSARKSLKALAGLTAGALIAVGLGMPAASAAPAGPAAPGCGTPVLAKAQRAQDVARTNSGAFTAAARRVGRAEFSLRAEANRDKELWLDRCGQSFFVEGKAPVVNAADPVQSAAASATDPATATVPLADTFTLQSHPGSARTIYLDFKGGTFTNTAWNQSYGSTIVAEPYSSSAPADTAFSDAELAEIQKAWQVVAEDYAAFDVNVTTMDPGLAAIDRSSSTDNNYGAHVIITNGGPVYTSCGCGGVSYVNVFNLSGTNHMYYQPAWVFSAGTGTSGKNIGEAAAHELGHQFGLSHDGTSTAGYSTGTAPWAPIMGASYYQPISQWSKGEYPDANNQQDDLAIIATGAPVRTDDFGNTAATAGTLTTSSPVNGVISSPTDVDAFTFTAAGSTTVTANPSPWMGDLDIKLTILDSLGLPVATVDPVATRVSSSQASGLNATWTAALPSTPATYTALIDGVGTGDPAIAGQYSDYGSIGNYQIALTTQTAPAPLTVAASTPPAARVGSTWSATPVSASGGTAPYSYSATGLPTGLSIASATGTISGTPTTEGTYPVSVTATDALGATATASVSIVVQPAVTALTLTTATPPAAKVGTAWSATPVSASGGVAPYSFAATGLPAGLTIAASTGTISGTPTTAGTYSVTVAVTDASLTKATATVSIVVKKLVLTKRTIGAATYNTSYSATPATASGGTAPYTYSASGLPSGLTMVSTTGLVKGVATRVLTASVIVTVKDATGDIARTTVSMVVRYAPVAVSTTYVGAVQKRLIMMRLRAVGGNGYYSWASAALPAGLHVGPTGILWGTPTTAGTYTFIGYATSLGHRVGRTITLKVVRS